MLLFVERKESEVLSEIDFKKERDRDRLISRQMTPQQLIPSPTGPARAWFLYRLPGVKPHMALSVGLATSTSWVTSANLITC